MIGWERIRFRVWAGPRCQVSSRFLTVEGLKRRDGCSPSLITAPNTTHTPTRCLSNVFTRSMKRTCHRWHTSLSSQEELNERVILQPHVHPAGCQMSIVFSVCVCVCLLVSPAALCHLAVVTVRPSAARPPLLLLHRKTRFYTIPITTTTTTAARH